MASLDRTDIVVAHSRVCHTVFGIVIPSTFACHFVRCVRWRCQLDWARRQLFEVRVQAEP